MSPWHVPHHARSDGCIKIPNIWRTSRSWRAKTLRGISNVCSPLAEHDWRIDPRNKEFIEAIELWKVNWNSLQTLRAWVERPVTCCEMPENHFTRIGMGASGGGKRKDGPGQMKIFSRFSYWCRNTTPTSPNRFLLVSSDEWTLAFNQKFPTGIRIEKWVCELSSRSIPGIARKIIRKST